jgi:hypothetical protein
MVIVDSLEGDFDGLGDCDPGTLSRRADLPRSPTEPYGLGQLVREKLKLVPEAIDPALIVEAGGFF